MTLSKQEANSVIDSTVVRAHQESAGGRGEVEKALLGGRRGLQYQNLRSCRFLTKSSRIAPYAGKPLRFILRAPLCASCKKASFIADKSYEGNAIITAFKAAGMKVFIPTKSNSRRPRRNNHVLYKERFIVNHFFHRLQAYHAVATRYCKTAVSFLSTISVSCLARI